MCSPKTLFAIAILALSPGHAEEPKVISVKKYHLAYPSSGSLGIPFHGCVDLSAKLPAGEGEYWLSLDHLISDPDFSKFEVLVNSSGGLMGVRATFKGSEDEWKSERGYASRVRVLFCFSVGEGEAGGTLSKELPLAYDGSDFGGMVYTFDLNGRVSWRLRQGSSPIDEKAYIERWEKHKLECAECKNISTAPIVVLPPPKSGTK